MDEQEFYDWMEDPYERHDDYNVFEEREIMNDREWEDDLDFDADWRMEDQHIDSYWEEA